MNKIEKLRQERKEVIKEYSSKKIENHSNDILTSMKELQYVRVSEIIEETHDTKSFILVPDKEKGARAIISPTISLSKEIYRSTSALSTRRS